MFMSTLSVIEGLAINMLFQDPRWFFISTLIVVFSICLHEFCHAFAAWKMGDPTAADAGHLTLNPLKQMGLVSLLMLFIIGIAWGAVPVNPQNIRSRWRALLISVAGPLANLFLFAAGWISFGIAMNHSSAVKPIVLEVTLFLGLINGVLFLFNMLPVPGLDGWAVVQTFFPKIKMPDNEVLKGIFMVLIFAVIFGLRYLFRFCQIVMLSAPFFFAVKSLPDDARRGALKDAALSVHSAYWCAEQPEAAFYRTDGQMSISRSEKAALLAQIPLNDPEIAYCAQYGDVGMVTLQDKELKQPCIAYIMLRKEDGLWYIDETLDSNIFPEKLQPARRATPLPEGVTLPPDDTILANVRHFLPQGTVIRALRKEIKYNGRDVVISVDTVLRNEPPKTVNFLLEYHDGGLGWKIFPLEK